jgi:hypothetical protein
MQIAYPVYRVKELNSHYTSTENIIPENLINFHDLRSYFQQLEKERKSLLTSEILSIAQELMNVTKKV